MPGPCGDGPILNPLTAACRYESRQSLRFRQRSISTLKCSPRNDTRQSHGQGRFFFGKPVGKNFTVVQRRGRQVSLPCCCCCCCGCWLAVQGPSRPSVGGLTRRSRAASVPVPRPIP